MVEEYGGRRHVSALLLEGIVHTEQPLRLEHGDRLLVVSDGALRLPAHLPETAPEAVSDNWAPGANSNSASSCPLLSTGCSP